MLQLYDQYGVWPPPTAPQLEPQASSFTPFSFGGPNGSPFDHPFFSRNPLNRSFAFTDPFELFRTLFGDIHNLHDDLDGFDDHFFGVRRSPFMASPFGRMDPLGSAFPFGGPSLLSGFDNGATSGGNMRSYSSVTQALGQGGQWVSQSSMTRTINGRTERIVKRRDAQVRRTIPIV